MSRKHFVAIAAAIQAQRLDPAMDKSLDALARDLAGTLASTNSNFNRSRFLTACGVK